MDQSLRTVATQLLNVTNPNESKESTQNPNTSNEKMSNVLLIEKSNEKTSHVSPSRFGNGGVTGSSSSTVALVSDVNSDKNLMGSIGVGFGRPVNSKFGYFESSHPGVAMALTEEELERELTAHKNHPTTPGGISTWVLMQSPTTTTDEPSMKIQLQNSSSSSSSKTEQAKTTFASDRISMAQSTSPAMEIMTSVKKSSARPIATTTAETLLNSDKCGQATLIPESTVSSTTPKTRITTGKKSTIDTSRLTMRAKLTPSPRPIEMSSKPTTSKIAAARPSSVQSIKPKVSPSKKPAATESPVETTKHPSTLKIEKVTFRPITVITTPKSNDIPKRVVEKPIFLTKLKTFITNGNPIEASTTTNNNATIVTKNEAKFVVLTKMKKANETPTETPTNIEIEAIKVNAPILQIEKPENSRIDAQFNFNPEIKQVETAAESLSATESIVTTTKRAQQQQQQQHKRKKNKLRRRRPASPTTSLGTTSATILTDLPTVAAPTERSDVSTELGIIENAIKESKIAAESKVSENIGTGIKSNKKKQVEKPIGTQIYNFLSREVMPSFGVVSLVGLGLGLASYLLYPFGGAIARRNYVVEPNYKYNMEEYGGGGVNYGQSEEEVFSKVLQGMTNNDGKYGGIKDYEMNFNRYQQAPTTRRISQASKYTTDPAAAAAAAASVYRPIASTNYPTTEKYRNTDFNKYPQLFATTSADYYERQKKPDFIGKKSADRQFVVGNIPKEYSYDKRANLAANLAIAMTETAAAAAAAIPVESHREKYKFPVDGHAEALKSTAYYDQRDIESTPSAAVQVEHGPRCLKLERKKRDSVIQLIGSRTEMEKEEKEIQTEEPLSNEILDIIDSVIPPNANDDDTREITNVKAAGRGEKIYRLDSDGSVIAGGNDTEGGSTVGSKKIAIRIESTRRTNLAVEQNEEKMAASREETTEETLFDSDSTTPTTTTTTISSSTAVPSLSIDEILGTSGDKTDETNSQDSNKQRFNIFSFVKKIAQVKLRLGVAILKHASEGFARYLGHVQKRINGQEQ